MKPWKPKFLQKFYTIDSNGEITIHTNYNDDFCKGIMSRRECFKTKENAENYSNSCKQLSFA